jgi:signal transduction histidine kinase
LSRRVDRLSLVAGAAIAALGGLLVLDQAGSLELDFPWLGVALAAAAGAILLASGLVEDGRRDRQEARPEGAPAEPADLRTALRRDPENGIVSGVLAGLAARLDLDPALVRIAFAVLVVASGGLALIAYALAWAVLPAAGAAPSTPAMRRLGSGLAHPGWRLGLGAGLLTLGALLLFRALGIWWSDALVWPLVLAGAGAAVLWRLQRGEAEGGPQPAKAEGSAASAEPVTAPRPGASLATLYRGGFGVALVVGAALLFLSANDALGATRDVAITAVAVGAALALILAPFLWRLGRSLAAERAERIRSQERTELAAHLHDSVLQTLTLMQKRAAEPREVAALARRQERELRAWLFDEGGSGAATFASALRRAAEEVEDAHGVPVEVVAVGDAGLDPGAEALVAAVREALTNAAKFAPDSGPVRLYAEADDGRLQAFVRDRGPGFDPEAVPADRRGVRESIVGRMARHGGRAEITSTPGEGTEVELTLDRSGP